MGGLSPDAQGAAEPAPARPSPPRRHSRPPTSDARRRIMIPPCQVVIRVAWELAGLRPSTAAGMTSRGRRRHGLFHVGYANFIWAHSIKAYAAADPRQGSGDDRALQVPERPNRSAAAARSVTCSLRTMEAMWTRTALGESTSRLAISAVERACASGSSTSHSRLVSRCSAVPLPAGAASAARGRGSAPARARPALADRRLAGADAGQRIGSRRRSMVLSR